MTGNFANYDRNRIMKEIIITIAKLLIVMVILFLYGRSKIESDAKKDAEKIEVEETASAILDGAAVLMDNIEAIRLTDNPPYGDEDESEFLQMGEPKEMAEMTEIELPIQDEENLEDEYVATENEMEIMMDETEVEIMMDETLESNTATGTETETATNGAGEEELFAAVPAFNFSNISIKGYDFLKPHIGEVAAALGHSNGTEELPGGGHIYVSDDNIALDALSDDQSYYSSVFIYSHDYFEREYCYLQIRNLNGKKTYESQLGESWCNIPVLLGDSYGRWCEQIGLDALKGSPLVYYEKYDWASSDSYSYNFQPEGRNARINYIEHKYTSTAWRGDWYTYDMQVDFFIQREDGRAFRMTAFFLNETIQDIAYYVYP